MSNTIKIFSRWGSTKVLFECEVPDGLQSALYVRHALEKATEARASLRGANLRGANLRDAYLSDANLRDANLSGANLSGANLSGASLSDANLSGANLRCANLSCANLSCANLRYANLRYANLSGANLRYANLSGADLSGANLSGADLRYADLSDAKLRYANLSGAPVLQNIHQTVYAAACVPGALSIGSWHCGTSHCRAGWVVTLAGEEGKALEEKIGTPAAAMAIYMASDPKRWQTEHLPDFYCGNDDALADMKRMAEEEAAAK